MALSTVCPTCNKQMEPYLDKKSDLVYCDLCNADIKANHFIKIQMKTLKQYKEKKTVPFAVKCQKCQLEDQPEIKGEKVICPKCKTEHTHLSEPFRLMLKNNLKNFKKDIE